MYVYTGLGNKRKRIADWSDAGFPSQCGATILHSFDIRSTTDANVERIKKAMYNKYNGDVTKLVMSAVEDSLLDALCIKLGCQHGTTRTNINSGNGITIYEIDVRDLR
ncbi:MAG: hypothetical protein KAS32_28560 [Candidatus Peribacteraceae bacterium]|nr:hypothetical protein [Candidatus Peribacteraceae bacterium]